MDHKKIEYKAPALEKGLDILELLAEVDKPLSKKEIAERLGRSVNEIFRMLSVLENRHYIRSDEKGSAYTLTMKMFALSNQHPPIARLLQHAHPLVEELCQKVEQSCHVSVYHNGGLLVVVREESPYKMGFCLRLGAIIDILGSGSGIILLAFSDTETRQRILNAIPASDKEKQDALETLEDTRRKGYFIGPSPQVAGITNISYPIFSVQNQLEAVITIPFLTLNSDTVHDHIESIESTRKELQAVAKKLTESVGGIFHL